MTVPSSRVVIVPSPSEESRRVRGRIVNERGEVCRTLWRVDTSQLRCTFTMDSGHVPLSKREKASLNCSAVGEGTRRESERETLRDKGQETLRDSRKYSLWTYLCDL